jgi:hypothetical protein
MAVNDQLTPYPKNAPSYKYNFEIIECLPAGRNTQGGDEDDSFERFWGFIKEQQYPDTKYTFRKSTEEKGNLYNIGEVVWFVPREYSLDHVFSNYGKPRTIKQCIEEHGEIRYCDDLYEEMYAIRESIFAAFNEFNIAYGCDGTGCGYQTDGNIVVRDIDRRFSVSVNNNRPVVRDNTVTIVYQYYFFFIPTVSHAKLKSILYTRVGGACGYIGNLQRPEPKDWSEEQCSYYPKTK